MFRFGWKADVTERRPCSMDAGRSSRSLVNVTLIGIGLGAPALAAATLSAGAGQGHYVAARALFPTSMPLTLLEGRINAFSIAIGLLQFPIYGGLLGWSIARRTYLPAILLASAHFCRSSRLLCRDATELLLMSETVSRLRDRRPSAPQSRRRPGVERKPIAMRFQPLTVTIASVIATRSCSSKAAAKRS